MLVVDYPPEESAEFSVAMKQHGLDPIFLLAPTSTEERIAGAAKLASGYVYYVSLKGRDRFGCSRRGCGRRAPAGLFAKNWSAGRCWLRHPRCRNGGRVAAIADAVVVGSRIIEEIEKSTPETACANVKALVSSIRRGMDAAA